MTFIIAEVGSNFHSLQDCTHSIQMAKACGADAVKFQLFDDAALYGWAGSRLELAQWSLPKEWIPILAEKAKAANIEFMCTAFNPSAISLIDPYVKRHKIASSDLTYLDLLEAVKKTGKQMLISTGGKSMGDVSRCLEVVGKDNVTLLYCEASYPAKYFNLEVINELRGNFKVPIGYSDHSTDVVNSPVMAVIHYGACVIEKHFIAIEARDTPDAPHSLNVDEFAHMVKAIRTRGKNFTFPTPAERDMITRHNRRLIAVRDIRKGELLMYNNNFGCYRSLEDDLKGLSGFDGPRIDRCIATKDIKQGEGISPDAFQRE